MATATKAAKRRARRGPKPPRDLRVERVVTSRPGHIEDTRATELTKKERRKLAKAAEPLIDAGEIDLSVMGVRFLELAFCGWTADRWRADPAGEGMGKADRAAWADRQFREAWEWWAGLHHATRAHVVRLTRLCASPDPVLMSEAEDQWRPVGRKVWRMP